MSVSRNSKFASIKKHIINSFSFLVLLIDKFERISNKTIKKNKMETILEDQRRLHEERERLIDIQVKEIIRKKLTVIHIFNFLYIHCGRFLIEIEFLLT
jgi:hypothetical protein